MAPLQKRALLTFLIGLVLAVTLLVVLLLAGDVTAFDRVESIRWVTYMALIGVPLTYLVLIDIGLRKPTQLDERDKLIILRAGKVQWLAVVFSLAAWMIALTEIYRAEGHVPTVYLSLIFMSILIISVLAQSLGIVLGYRGMNRDG
jgi:uncharacterized membrane protein